MQNPPTNGSGALIGSATSIVFLFFSAIPEVPHIAAWVCCLLSATASILSIIKLVKSKK